MGKFYFQFLNSSVFSSPVPFWGGGGTRRQATTLGEVEEVEREQQPSSRTTNYSARAQKDLPLVTPESGSVQTVQNRLTVSWTRTEQRIGALFPSQATLHHTGYT